MNSKDIVAIKDTENLCYKCLKKKNKVHKINIGSRGYGSYFDNFSTSLQLCDDCYIESIKDKPIWNMESLDDKNMYDDSYLYDNEMSSYLHSLPLESRELVFNRNAYGACAGFRMKPQDYIDYELNELPHKICKHYCVYSPEEKTAYKERFPNCGCVEIIKYSDGSQGSKCPYGAFGDKDGNIDLNISDKCYMCTHYNPRQGDIKMVNEGTVEYYENEKDRLIHMIQYAENGLNELEKNMREYMSNYTSDDTIH